MNDHVRLCELCWGLRPRPLAPLGSTLLIGTLLGGEHDPKRFSPGVTFVIAEAAATNFPLFVGLIGILITGP